MVKTETKYNYNSKETPLVKMKFYEKYWTYER
jgi:hypothetical protein